MNNQLDVYRNSLRIINSTVNVEQVRTARAYLEIATTKLHADLSNDLYSQLKQAEARCNVKSYTVSITPE